MTNKVEPFPFLRNWHIGCVMLGARKIFLSRFFTERGHERISHQNNGGKKIDWLPRKIGEK
jgi:hypothetical protein